MSNPALLQCAKCTPAKFGKRKKGFHTKIKPLLLGVMFQMEHGFIRDLINNSSSPSNDAPTKLPLQTYMNGYNCYLLITDACTRCSWLFSFADKKPPTATVKAF